MIVDFGNELFEWICEHLLNSLVLSLICVSEDRNFKEETQDFSIEKIQSQLLKNTVENPIAYGPKELFWSKSSCDLITYHN